MRPTSTSLLAAPTTRRLSAALCSARPTRLHIAADINDAAAIGNTMQREAYSHVDAGTGDDMDELLQQYRASMDAMLRGSTSFACPNSAQRLPISTTSSTTTTVPIPRATAVAATTTSRRARTLGRPNAASLDSSSLSSSPSPSSSSAAGFSFLSPHLLWLLLVAAWVAPGPYRS